MQIAMPCPGPWTAVYGNRRGGAPFSFLGLIRFGLALARPPVPAPPRLGELPAARLEHAFHPLSCFP